MASNFRALGPYPRRGLSIALAAVFPIDWIEALRIAVARAPRTRHRRRLDVGGHQRAECLEQPGRWCRLSGSGRCDSCPFRNGELDGLRRALESAEELRREWDTAMWSTSTEGEPDG
jgi:hypothetical protein